MEQKDLTAARMKFHAVIIAIVVQILNVKMTFESCIGLSDVLYYCNYNISVESVALKFLLLTLFKKSSFF